MQSALRTRLAACAAALAATLFTGVALAGPYWWPPLGYQRVYFDASFQIIAVYTNCGGDPVGTPPPNRLMFFDTPANCV